ncbi:MAG: hypothetical protein ABI232_00115 [Jatrophihabitantaceae bacterium]
MGRHTNPQVARRDSNGLTRLGLLLVLWLAGLATGYYALLAAASRYTTCTAHSTGLACRTSGFSLAIALVVGVVAVVTAATVVSYQRQTRWNVLIALAALIALGVCVFAAHGLLDTA